MHKVRSIRRSGEDFTVKSGMFAQTTLTKDELQDILGVLQSSSEGTSLESGGKEFFFPKSIQWQLERFFE